MRPRGKCEPSLLPTRISVDDITCRSQEVRPRSRCTLAAPMARIIALMALDALGLSGAPVHEPVHAEAPLVR
jgi:hypothetical protein